MKTPDTAYIFIAERSDSKVSKMVKRAGENAKIKFPVYPMCIQQATS